MQKINNREELKAAIEQLEKESKLQGQALKLKAQELMDRLKPGNILRDGLHQIIAEPHRGRQVVNALLGLGAGLLVRRFIPVKNASVLKKAVGTALQVGVANLVAQKASGWKFKPGKLFRGRKNRSSHNGNPDAAT